MNTPSHFGWFQNTDGSYNQQTIGTTEAQRGWSLTPQLYNEDRTSFEQRSNAYSWEKQQNGG